jgi:hypothetical protein
MGWLPRKSSLNGAMPLLINISVGSFFTTIGAEDTIWCPLSRKKSKNACLISAEVMSVILIFLGYLCAVQNRAQRYPFSLNSSDAKSKIPFQYPYAEVR